MIEFGMPRLNQELSILMQISVGEHEMSTLPLSSDKGGMWNLLDSDRSPTIMAGLGFGFGSALLVDVNKGKERVFDKFVSPHS